MGAHGELLKDRLEALSVRLCGCLNAALRAALGADQTRAGCALRPVQLTANLGLDKSLASRIVRSLGAKDPLRALHGMPTPQGLMLVTRAASGAGEDELAALGDAIERYAALLAEFSGGRTDLEATLTGWIPEESQRAERAARRSVFRGMTVLSGTRTSALYGSLYLIPCEDPARVDSLVVAVRQDLRRLRQGTDIVALQLAVDEGAHPGGQRRCALDGSPLGSDAEGFLVRELCSHPLPMMRVAHGSKGVELTVHEEALDVNEFVTLGLGWRTRQHFPARIDGARDHGSFTVSAPRPTEALVLDLFVHSDVAMEGAPFASLTPEPGRRKGGGEAPPAPGSAARLRAPRVTHLDASPSGLGSPHVRQVAAIAENVCREAGFDVGAFTRFRTQILFPLPTEELTLWWPLA